MLLGDAKQAMIGQTIDAAIDLVEKESPSLKGVLPKNYGRADLDKRLLRELVDLIESIGFTDVDHGADDVLGKVYEYFLGKFAAKEGRGGGVLPAALRGSATGCAMRCCRSCCQDGCGCPTSRRPSWRSRASSRILFADEGRQDARMI